MRPAETPKSLRSLESSSWYTDLLFVSKGLSYLRQDGRLDVNLRDLYIPAFHLLSAETTEDLLLVIEDLPSTESSNIPRIQDLIRRSIRRSGHIEQFFIPQHVDSLMTKSYCMVWMSSSKAVTEVVAKIRQLKLNDTDFGLPGQSARKLSASTYAHLLSSGSPTLEEYHLEVLFDSGALRTDVVRILEGLSRRLATLHPSSLPIPS